MRHNIHSPWRKSAIMPIWSFQLILLSVDLIIAALLLVIINNMPTQVFKIDGQSVTVTGGTQNWNIANLVISAISLLATCCEIVLYIGSDLSPTLFLGSSIMKAVTWTIVLALDVISINSNWEKGRWNNYIVYVVIGFAGAVYITLIVGVVYAVVVYLRHRGTIANNVDKYMMSRSEGSLDHY